MPVYDADGGLVWSGYNAGVFGKVPRDESATKPFYFGASAVPLRGEQKDTVMKGNGMSRPVRFGVSSGVVKTMPNIRRPF